MWEDRSANISFQVIQDTGRLLHIIASDKMSNFDPEY